MPGCVVLDRGSAIKEPSRIVLAETNYDGEALQFHFILYNASQRVYSFSFSFLVL